MKVFSFATLISYLGTILLVHHVAALNSASWNFASKQSDSDGDRRTQNNNELLFDRGSGNWYAFGTKGPCGKNMIFYHHPTRSRQGFCDCDQGLRSKYPCSDFPIRRMVYLPFTRQCHHVFSQGPCGDGQWLNIGTNSEPECQPNVCQKYIGQSMEAQDTSAQFWFSDPLRRSCYRAQSRGYCPVGLTLELTHNSHLPKCRKKLCYPKLTDFVRSSMTCKPGTRFSYYMKGCVRKANKNYASVLG